MCQLLLIYTVRQWVVYMVQLNPHSIRCSCVWLYELWWWWWMFKIDEFELYSERAHSDTHTRAHKYLYIVIEQLYAIRNIKACTYAVSRKQASKQAINKY